MKKPRTLKRRVREGKPDSIESGIIGCEIRLTALKVGGRGLK